MKGVSFTVENDQLSHLATRRFIMIALFLFYFAVGGLVVIAG